MKLLKLTVNGLPTFKEQLDLAFYAQQRVSDADREMLVPLFANISPNPTNHF